MLKTLILETVRDRAISTKFLACRVYEESTGEYKPKSLSPQFFGGHLEFLRKTQNTFIWQTVCDFDETFDPALQS